MAGVEIPDIDCILAPGRFALGFKGFPKISDPNLFTNSLWDGFAFIFRVHVSDPGHLARCMYVWGFSIGLRPIV
jgi:hypothetical protein